MARVLDARGKGCPRPAVEALKIFSELKPGEELVVYTDEEKCLEIIKGFIAALGIGTLEHRKRDGYLEIVLKSGGAQPRKELKPDDFKC